MPCAIITPLWRNHGESQLYVVMIIVIIIMQASDYISTQYGIIDNV